MRQDIDKQLFARLCARGLPGMMQVALGKRDSVLSFQKYPTQTPVVRCATILPTILTARPCPYMDPSNTGAHERVLRILSLLAVPNSLVLPRNKTAPLVCC